MEKRNLIHLALLGSVAFAANYSDTPKTFAYPIIDDSGDRYTSLQNNSRETSSRGGARFMISKSPLTTYLNSILPLERIIEQKIEAQDTIFNGFRLLTKQQELTDFRKYFPMWYAGELEYNVPWEILWITHITETNVSTEDRPERNGFKGAMQRHPEFYTDDKVRKISSDWQFLKDLDQRYSRDKNYLTNDYEEIIFAAWKMNTDASTILKKNPSLPWEKAILLAQYNYCIDWSAEQRINQYLRLKEIFRNSN